MPPDKSQGEYARLVAEAEAAVAAVKDPELRRVAFEKILATLIENGESSARRPARGREAITSAAHRKRGKSQSRRGPKAYIEELVADGFFKKKQRTIADVKAELANRGHHIALTGLSGPLQALTQQRKLRRQKATSREAGKSTYVYSVW